MVAAALATLGLPAPTTSRRWASLLRTCGEETGLLVGAEWDADDVRLWLESDLARQPVDPTRVRDRARFTAALLGKMCEAVAAGARRPTLAKAEQEAAAAAAAAEAARQRAEQEAEQARRDYENEMMVAEAAPHLAAMSPTARAALLPPRDRQRAAEYDNLDDLPRSLLVPLAWAWHNEMTRRELADVGWRTVAEVLAEQPDQEWLAEKVTAEQSTHFLFGSFMLHDAWCKARHNHRGVCS